MTMDQRLSLKQSLKLQQKLILTPQLRLALEILQMNRLELEESIFQELEVNPFLEAETPAPEEGSQHEENPPVDHVAELEHLSNLLEEGFRSYHAEQTAFHYGGAEEDEEERVDPLSLATHTETLSEHLAWQLQMNDFSSYEVKIGAEIIGNLDSDGYLRVEPEEIANGLGVPLEDVENVRRRIQEFDPPGVASRNLSESLAVQLKVSKLGDEIEMRMVTELLQYTLNRNTEQLKKVLKVDDDRLRRAYEIISHLDPKPGRNFSTTPVEAVIPDLKVVQKGDDFDVILMDERIPRLRLSSHYRKYLQAAKDNPDIAKFLLERYQRAQGIIKGIFQRNDTLLKVGRSIVKFQKEFMLQGPEHMTPLTLKDVAADVDMHESTISRITTNKWIDTPWGIFPLKHFFSSKVRGAGGETHSSIAVKEKIKKLIKYEDPARPLSDDEIARRLKSEGINIARRTVAKYRDALGIPSSSQRRRLKSG